MDSRGSHVDLSQFCPSNFNIGLTDRQLITISIKELNTIIKHKGKLNQTIITNTKYIICKVCRKKKLLSSSKRDGLYRTEDTQKDIVTVKRRRRMRKQERLRNWR